MKCKICKTNEGVLRDRENPTNRIKSICRKCHAERLQEDIERVKREFAESVRAYR